MLRVRLSFESPDGMTMNVDVFERMRDRKERKRKSGSYNSSATVHDDILLPPRSEFKRGQE